jgi:hypothetical protein
MIFLYYILFSLGLISYGLALFFIKNSAGEILSDLGNALVLITCALLLFRMISRDKTHISKD